MPKLSIRNILIAINVVFLFLFVVFSVFSFLSISKVSENYDGLIKGFYQYKTLSDTASVLKEIKISPSADVNALSLEAESHFNEFLKHAPVKTESGVKMTQDLKNALAKEINSLKQGGAQVADASEFDDLANDFNGLIMKYDVNGGADFIVEFSRKNNFYMILLSFLFVGLIFASHIIVRKLVTNRISEVNHLSRMIADGDLTGDIAVGRKDEIGGLFLNIREMQQFLKDIISSVKNDVRLIDGSSSAIAEGNLDLSSRTQQQASSLQETAASMEEIKTTVANNSQNAHSANQLAQHAKTTVAKGTEVMNGAVSTMGDIEKYAHQISEISAVINSIANQTNILALNAAVEAARAGEQGRGFAVVASEVRNLAIRSGNAAQEINDLINNAVKSVAQGTEQVSHAGEAMEDIFSSVSRVSEIMEEITVASDEQNLGINQIAAAVNQMDAVTLQNASLVDASAQSTRNLNALAKNLSGTMSRFRLAMNTMAGAAGDKKAGA
jgi:methyl-accepting chemotaxis protein-1 (serine sensor receptor)